MKEKNNKVKDERIQATVIVVFVFLLLVLVAGVTYAAFYYTKEGQVVNQISTSTMTMSYVEGKTGINITNATPLTDEVGKNLSNTNEMFDFTVSTQVVNQGIMYEVVAVKDINSTLGNNDVKLYLQSGTTAGVYNKEELVPTHYTPLSDNDAFGAKAGEMVLATKEATSSGTTYLRLRMRVADDYNIDTNPKSFSVKVNVYGKELSS